MRIREQEESARIGEYELEILRLPDGTIPREACLQVSIPLLAALWNSIRSFEPDYIFCPPIPSDPLAGIHVDHVAVAEAVRKVAYMINVPHAFTPEYPSDETKSRPCKVPVILNLYDGYMAGANSHHIAVDVEDAFESICRMTYCHQSQIAEWLPWVDRHQMCKPESFEDWRKTVRVRFDRQNREVGLPTGRAFELFTVTAWGRIPKYDQLLADVPNVAAGQSNLDRLKAQLTRWS